MKFIAIVFLLILALAPHSTAQTPASEEPISVDGSVHPELIPDDAAALAVFGVHSMFADPAAEANTEKHHAKIGLSQADHAIYDAAMRSFRNTKGWRTQALPNLLNALGPDGQAKLKAFIQSEKRHMHFDRQVPIPQEVNQ